MRRIPALLGLLLVLALPGTAAATTSTCQHYNKQLCASVGATSANKTTGSGPTATAASTLPFTGIDLVLLVAVSGGLLSVGLIVRRLSHQAD
jgi:hypothetical protein